MNQAHPVCIDSSEVNAMKRTKLFAISFGALGMLLLILDARTALTAAREGIDLCLRTVIPALLPFFLLSGILVGNLLGTSLPFAPSVGKWLGIPKGAESLLIPGFLGGYPTGAAAVQEAWKTGRIRKRDAERLLCFCNNAGPSFLFGMVAPLFSDPSAGWMLWLIHIAGALTAGMVLREEPEAASLPFSGKEVTVQQAMTNALNVCAKVCGWVILFRIVTGFLKSWFLWLLPDWGQVLAVGILELTNGCMMMNQVESEPLRFLLCGILLSFGGICVHMQTLSCIDGLSSKRYFHGKLLQTVFVVFYSLAYLFRQPLYCLFAVLPFLMKKKTKRGRNPKAAVV